MCGESASTPEKFVSVVCLLLCLNYYDIFATLELCLDFSMSNLSVYIFLIYIGFCICFLWGSLDSQSDLS